MDLACAAYLKAKWVDLGLVCTSDILETKVAFSHKVRLIILPETLNPLRRTKSFIY
jgi:hypothetical protein